MTLKFRKNANKKVSGSTKLRKGSWLDDTLDPFHSAKAVDSLFKRVDQLKKKDRKSTK